MILSNKQILNLPVYTKSGDFLGRVIGFELEVDLHRIVRYYVGSSSFVKNLLKNKPEFLISDNQVINITEEKMTVEDSTIKVLEKNKESISSKQPEPTVINSKLS